MITQYSILLYAFMYASHYPRNSCDAKYGSNESPMHTALARREIWRLTGVLCLVKDAKLGLNNWRTSSVDPLLLDALTLAVTEGIVDHRLGLNRDQFSFPSTSTVLKFNVFVGSSNLSHPNCRPVFRVVDWLIIHLGLCRLIPAALNWASWWNIKMTWGIPFFEHRFVPNFGFCGLLAHWKSTLWTFDIFLLMQHLSTVTTLFWFVRTLEHRHWMTSGY